MAERPCQVCSHPSRLAIDQALLNGKGLRPTAVAFGIGSGEFGTDSFKPDHKKVQRHIDRCMGEAYRAAKEADQIDVGRLLIQRMERADEIVDGIVARNIDGVPLSDENGPLLKPDGTPYMKVNERVLLSAVSEMRRNAEMRAKLAGALPEGDEDAVTKARAALNSPEARKALADLDAILAQQDQ